MIDEWNGFSIVCPDTSENDFEILGHQGSMVNKKMTFQVRACNSEIDKIECASQSDLNSWLIKKGIMIDTWVI